MVDGDDTFGRGFVRVEGNKAQSTLVEFTINDGRALFEGDIVLGDAAELAETTEGEPLEVAVSPGSLPTGTQSSLAIVGLGHHWPNGVIPYKIDDSLRHPDRTHAAIEHWSALTPVRFVARTTEDDYVTFRTREDACYSNVGRIGHRSTVRRELQPTHQ